MDVWDIFYFFLLGEGQGESESPGRGGGRFFLVKFPGKGGILPREGVGGGGQEGVCGEFWGGGELDVFFRARNAHQDKHQRFPE